MSVFLGLLIACVSKNQLIYRMHIHLVIVQPDHYVHSLGFLDTADYLKYWLQQQGIHVTVAKNRLRHDAVNLVFGAHLGFHPQWLEASYCTFFFNLEQIGQGGAQLPDAYKDLLRSGHVIDYHPANVASYRDVPESVPLIPFLNAPYLNPAESQIKIADRPIDLLFFGSINAERKAFLKRIEKAGLDVAVFDAPTYYQERDAYVRQAKAVINTSFYASARFEQVRAFNVLSQGTAFISFLQAGQKMDVDFRDHVFWVEDKNFDLFFKEQFAKEAWCLAAEQKFNQWRLTNPHHAMTDLIQVLQSRWQNHVGNLQPAGQHRRLVQGADGRYFHDAVNLSPNVFDQADLDLDLCEKQNWPWAGTSRWGQNLQIYPGQIQLMVFRVWPCDARQWRGLFKNAIALLSLGGELRVEISTADYDFSSDESLDLKTAERTWTEFSDHFWRSGLFTEKFSSQGAQFFNQENKSVEKNMASKIIIVFKKIKTSMSERTKARVQSPNFCTGQ